MHSKSRGFYKLWERERNLGNCAFTPFRREGQKNGLKSILNGRMMLSEVRTILPYINWIGLKNIHLCYLG